ncbi:SH3 domain-containing YSC84-like protein 1 [Ophiophagus hannah]|uniref:SH3 domain-containing YSC84-like protein 1 n=1 Tax=Ophiophagus hannah TaxID=8665 RepID=V8NXC1_OPHHA|nr:SH3 domain-containing YSC84-like protein 1 [Ophiophagus hannah]
MNNPIPSNLKSEAKKAAKILREFTEITSRNGPDKLIPAHVIAKAKGLAILSVIKAGFLVTARGGSGIVLARLPNGGWSAPSAIGIAGLGGGFEIGIEVSDLVIILNHERAVEAFAKGGNLTLGGNFTVAIGPLGSAILFGDISPPLQAQDLYDILESFTLQYEVEEGRSYSSAPVAKEPRKNYVKLQSSRTPQNITPEAPRTSNRLYPELPKNYTATSEYL